MGGAKAGKKEEKPKREASVIREVHKQPSEEEQLAAKKEKTENAQKKLAEALGELNRMVRNQKGLADKIEARTKELGALEAGIPNMEKSLAALEGELEAKNKAQAQRRTHLKNMVADLEAKKKEMGKLLDLAKNAGLEDVELMDLGKLSASLKDRQKRGEEGLQIKIERVAILIAKLRELGNAEENVKRVKEEVETDKEAFRDMGEGIVELRKEIAAAHERIEGKGAEKGLRGKLEETKDRFMTLNEEIGAKIREIEELKREAGLAEPGEKPRQ